MNIKDVVDFFVKNKHKDMQKRVEKAAPAEDFGTVQGIYKADIAQMRKVFENDDLMKFHEIEIGASEKTSACLIFCEGLVDTDLIDNYVIRPLQQMDKLPKPQLLENTFQHSVFQVNNLRKTEKIAEMVQGITYGDTVLLIDGLPEAFIFGAKKFKTRGVSEPDGEKVLSGPREGFTEVIMDNLSMIRRKLRTDKLKMQYLQLGRETKTQLCIAYLQGIARQNVIDELYNRLKRVDIDSVLDANYVNEIIRDNRWSPFRTMGYTERPDIVAAKLLEGRVAIIVDGSPVVLTLPYLFTENFQSNEDYYLNFHYTSFSRFLRILGFWLTTMVPGIYIAVVAYHQEMLPAPLLISIAKARQSVPLPASIEAFIMLIIFEILRETSIRMQSNVGQALSIAGALVVGQAAVEAKLVSSPMIIVVALTGITSLLVPKMNAPIITVRFGVLLLASSLGFFGVTIGFVLTLTHMLSLRSFGAWELLPDHSVRMQSLQDAAIRVPWFKMLFRPARITQNTVRQNESEEEG